MMLRKLREFEYREPSTLSEAIAILNQYGKEVKVLAGGTDLLVNMKERGWEPRALVNLKTIPGLSYIRFDEKEGLRIGALTTVREVEASSLIREKFPCLHEGAKSLGSVQVRNRATLGGNLCNASPAADNAPPLLVLNARVKLVGLKGERVLPLEKFFVGPGVTVLDNEVLTEIMVPASSQQLQGVYLTISRREAVDLAQVGVAVAARAEGKKTNWRDVRIALGAVAPTPIRAYETEKLLEGREIQRTVIEEAVKKSIEEVTPITDLRASQWYRGEMVKVLAQRALEQIAGQIRGRA
jgi:CO/xanthine dehydrogenase FAD-binding subunit